MAICDRNKIEIISLETHFCLCQERRIETRSKLCNFFSNFSKQTGFEYTKKLRIFFNVFDLFSPTFESSSLIESPEN